MKPRLILVAAIALLVVALPVTLASAGGPGHHHGHHYGNGKSNAKLVRAHVKALADCDADALVGGYTRDAVLFFPDGVIVEGREALQELYDGFVKSPQEGGLCGLQAKPVREWRSGKTSFVKFEVTAPFLEKTYFSTDGYVFKHGKIAAEMSTFDASKLVFKK